MVRAYLRLGHLSPQTEVRREGDAHWTASGDVSLFANCGRGLPESHEVMGILDRAEQSAYDAQTVFAVQRGTPLFPQTPSRVPEAAGGRPRRRAPRPAPPPPPTTTPSGSTWTSSRSPGAR